MTKVGRISTRAWSLRMSLHRLSRTCLAVGILAALALPLAGAHEAPRPRAYEDRLIHDCTDDYFGGDQPSDSRQGHDLLALDVREAYDATLGGDVLVFRLLANDNAHSGSELKDEVSFTAKGQVKKYAFTTTNNQQFTGTFERVTGPHSVNDGTRFAVEGILRLTTLGLQKGDKISAFKVEAFHGGTRGDFMPGSFDSSLGPGGTTCPVGSQGRDTIQPDYAIKGPVDYASWTIEPRRVTVPMGSPQLVSLHITNELRQDAQTITLDADADPGIAARFHNVADNEYEDPPYQFELAGDVERHLVHLQLTGEEAGAEGRVAVELRTNLGGRIVDEVTFTVAQPGAPTTAASTPQDTTTAAGGAPAPALVLLLLAIGALALVGRRRQ